MKNLYYLLWVDAIVHSKDYKDKARDWKVSVFFLITVTNALNFFVLIIGLDFFNINAHKYLSLFESNSLWPSAFSGFVIFGLPFAIINYFAIFYKSRYLKLISKYSSPYNGKLALSYTLVSIVLVIITVILTA